MDEYENLRDIALGCPDFDDDALRNALTLLEIAFAEDLGTPTPCLYHEPDHPVIGDLKLRFHERPGPSGDLTTSATIPPEARGSARFVARGPGVVAGLPILRLTAHRFSILAYEELVGDGDPVGPGTVIATMEGLMGPLLALERTALNFLQRLSGVATLTARFVQEVKGTKAVILDTRKTTPGWRALEKYAVRCGGGKNHRFGLYDAVLIKDNHLATLASLGHPDPIGAAVASAKEKAPAGTVVEVEVDTLDQFDRALACRPDIVLVDNLGPENLAEAARRRDERAPSVLLEASGGVSLATVGAIARTGVDRISVGALTHSAPALDIGLDFGRSAPS
jgi:nicotinate-nucleotide pyrophosphorylase (carboxylating)